MSLSQLLALAEALHEPRHPVYDFGLGMHPRQLQTWNTPQSLMSSWHDPTWTIPPAAGMVANRRHTQQNVENGERWPICQVGKDGFQVCMDVTQFTPSELSVKVVENSIVVEGKHEEREDDHGYISRHFVRRYAIPPGFEADKVVSSLSSDGVLTVSVPKPQAIQDKSKERSVQIQQVGPAHLNVKQNDAEQKRKEDAKPTNGNAK